MLDAEAAALVWLLVEGGVPLVVAAAVPPDVSASVAGEGLDAAHGVVGAFLEVVGGPVVHDGPTSGAITSVAELAARDHGTGADTTPAPRGAVVGAASLEELFRVLAAPPHRLSDDAVRSLGVVLVVRDGASGDRPRVVAAHYLRPVERDGHGHLQRRPPAVLATWDAEADAFEHFAWGVTPELASRVGRTQAELEIAQRRRATFLDLLVRAGTTDHDGVRAALARYRLEEQLDRPLVGSAANGSRPHGPHAHDHDHDA
jgi:hypothetical protein